jgi:ATP adenylyltransferase
MGEVLWAPWRMDYILSDKEEGCIFCDKPREQRDAANYILWRGRTTFVMLNRYPYTNAHLMVVPQAHVAALRDLDATQRTELIDVTTMCEDVLQRALRPDGLNLGMNLGAAAGAGIAAHLHLHLVPRWQGDTNYMPVIADIRVIPQHLEHTYHMLLPYFHAHHQAPPS